MSDTDRDHLLDYSIPQLLRWRVAKSGDKTALREKDFGRWISYSWDQYYDFTRKTGLGLRALGFAKDEKIAVISDNIPEVLYVAIGAQAVGGISIGLYQTTLPDEIAQILDALEVSVVFCNDQEQVDKVDRKSVV